MELFLEKSLHTAVAGDAECLNVCVCAFSELTDMFQQVPQAMRVRVYVCDGSNTIYFDKAIIIRYPQTIIIFICITHTFFLSLSHWLRCVFKSDMESINYPW